jgi:uncharacterized protein (UPF0332 family)
VSDVARELWARASASLAGAEALIAVDPDGAASRAYYAAFHAVSALFILRGRSFTSHKAIEAAVHRDLVLAGEWAKERGADYSFLGRLRRTGDYGGHAHVSTDDARSATEAAKRILGATRAIGPPGALGD